MSYTQTLDFIDKKIILSQCNYLQNAVPLQLQMLLKGALCHVK